MSKPLAASLCLVLAAGAWSAGSVARASGTRADDDLAVVKRAVATTPQARAQDKPAAPAASKADTPSPKATGKPLWLRVRVTERGGKKVSINLPLGLVRAMGDWPIDWRCGDEHETRRCRIRIGEVLEALDAGQSLVEIDDEGAKVRVWVE